MKHLSSSSKVRIRADINFKMAHMIPVFQLCGISSVVQVIEENL
jgi:hypothetical protein